MSIDIIKAKKVFKEYVKNYNPEDEQIKIKIAHIERVSQIAKTIAEQQNCSQEDIELAELIGLLHDIGRFEQVRLYHTFDDKNSINHGEYGVKVLFDDGLIRKFIDTQKFDKIIKISILNHNRGRKEIDKGLTQRENLHIQIIRDADKIDIFHILMDGDKKAIYGSNDLSDDLISDEIFREFMEDKLIKYKNIETSCDILVSHFAYVYEFYFNESLKIIRENNYLDKLYKRFKFNNKETQERFDKIYKTSKQYLEEKG